MRTTLELISARLTEFDPYLKLHLAHPELAVITHVSLTDGFPKDADISTLYLIKDNQLILPQPPHSNCNLLCFGITEAAALLAVIPDCNSITMTGDISITKIIDTITELLADQRRFTLALNEMVDALYYGQGLQAIVDISSELFRNPVFIINSGLNSLAKPKSFPIRNPIIRADAERNHIDNNAFHFLKEHGWFDKLRSNGSVIFFPAEAYSDYVGEETVYEWCYCYVRVNGVVVAYINIFGENCPLLDYHRDWAIKISQLVSIELQKNNSFLNSDDAMYEALLTDLLEDRITDQMFVQRRLEMLACKIKSHLHVITIHKLFKPSVSLTISPVEQDRLRSFFPGSSSVAYKGNVVLLVSSDDGEIQVQDDMATLNNRFSESGLVAGISNVFSDIIKMAHYYQQSIKALEFGKNLFSVGGIYPYSEYTIFHALELCTEHINLRDLCHPGVLTLQESPYDGDKELFQTLYLYLLYMKDVNKICAALSIHRSTLFYRLNKLKSILGIDLDEGNTWFQLMFSFKLIEYMDIFSPGETQLPSHTYLHKTKGSE